MNISELFSVNNKVVLITGGSRGIGEMMARGFLANGAKVYISSRKIKDCEATAHKLSQEYKSECISIPADISDLNGINQLFNKFIKLIPISLFVSFNEEKMNWIFYISCFVRKFFN